MCPVIIYPPMYEYAAGRNFTACPQKIPPRSFWRFENGPVFHSYHYNKIAPRCQAFERIFLSFHLFMYEGTVSKRNLCFLFLTRKNRDARSRFFPTSKKEFNTSCSLDLFSKTATDTGFSNFCIYYNSYFRKFQYFFEKFF